MLRYVGDPELIGSVAVKLTRDPIFGGGETSHTSKLWASRDSLNLGSMHEELNSLVTNRDALA